MPTISAVGGASSAVAYGGGTSTRPGELNEDQKRQVEELARRDREVRAHEQAHLAAAGGFATSGASFTYTRGPDGKQYATGGEVSIDVSAGRTPQETITKSQAVQRAALAPANPSGQDRAVAAAAARQELRARQDLAKQATEKQGNAGEANATQVRSATTGAYQAAYGGEAAAPSLNVTA